MGYKINPFTANFDEVNGPAGTFTDVDLSGDLTLGSGIPTTTLQAITPTADRTISFPDATGTVALVSGSNGTVQYNEGGVLKGNSDFTVDPDWNDAGVVFTGLKLNVTDTASAAGSKVLDLQVGGTSFGSVAPDGSLSVGRQATGFRGFTFNAASGDSLELSRPVDGGVVFSVNEGGNVTCRGVTSSVDGYNWSSDVYLLRDAANTLAQRNGTNAQTYRLYNTYTDASNYERGFFQWNSDVLEIGSEGAGTGSEQPVRITAATLKLPNLPTYADNTAATSGGLVAGDVYKTATGELRITV